MTIAEPAHPYQSVTLWRANSYAPVTTRIAIAGDFLPAGNLARLAHCSWRDMAAPIMPHFADVSTTFANLECAVGVEGLSARSLNGIGQIVSTQPEALEYLAAINCHCIGIANNHAYDFGNAGINRTCDAISKRGPIPLGAGRSLKEAPQTFVWHGPGNLRVGFWAAAKAAHEIATHKLAGVEPATIDRATQAFEAMKQQGANFSVALPHAGCLRTNRPAPEDVSRLRAMTNCGFNVIAASHSHRISGFEKIFRPDGPPAHCFYGLGSIVSGYIASEFEREGLIVVAGFDASGDLAEIAVRPVYLSETGFGEVPSSEIAHIILHRFEALSVEISDGSYRAAFYREMSRGLLSLYLRDARSAFLESGVRGLARKATRLRIHHLKRLMHRVLAI
jgi:poly-gamma-glutamate synthesis protein (capsule biosynthesis protein)